LHNWQIEALHYFFNNNCLAMYQCATGTGKTYFGIELIKEVFKKDPNIRVLIVVPKNVILETGWYKELYDGGFSLNDIGVYYGDIKEYAKITITNMQSLNKVSLEIFDMIIFDEVHNYATKRLLPFIKKDVKYKVGLTATLDRIDNKHFELLKIFNYNVYKYTPKKALDDNVLNPFNFTNIGVEMDDDSFNQYTLITTKLNSIFQAGGGYNKIMKSNSPLKGAMLQALTQRKQLVNNYKRKMELVKIICKKHKNDKIIIFNEFNAQSNKLYWYLLDIGIKSCLFHSSMGKRKKEDNLIEYKKGKYNVMLATKAIEEGFNLPKIDVGIIMAGNSTKKQMIQRMGRVLRKKDKESSLYQVYCTGTIEERYAMDRTKMFTELCSDYKLMFYDLDGELK
jgi:superfamily II DNA or RNA helicase